jgi:hypothetical protein
VITLSGHTTRKTRSSRRWSPSRPRSGTSRAQLRPELRRDLPRRRAPARAWLRLGPAQHRANPLASTTKVVGGPLCGRRCRRYLPRRARSGTSTVARDERARPDNVAPVHADNPCPPSQLRAAKRSAPAPPARVHQLAQKTTATGRPCAPQ